MSCCHCGRAHDEGAKVCPVTGRSMGDAGLVGQLVSGKYQVLNLLGAGGMGEVYECEHIGVGRRVCLKRLHPEFRINEMAMARFQREAKVAAAIDHENVIEIFDVGVADDGSPYFVMPRLSGESLATVIHREGALPVPRASDIAAQVLRALVAAHTRNIVHRDLKPDNVFLVRRAAGGDQVTLLDFGISKISDGAPGLTTTGALLGTPAYMSPEQARGQKTLDHRTDLWATGVMLFEMLSGTPAYQADTYPEMLMKIVSEPPPRLIERNPQVPPTLAALIDRSLAKDIAQRFQSASELLTAIEPWIGWREGLPTPAPIAVAVAHTISATPASVPGVSRTLPSISSSAGEMRPTPQAPVRRGRALAGTGAALALCGLGAVWFALGHRAPVPVSPTPAAPAAAVAPPPAPVAVPPVAASAAVPAPPAAATIELSVAATPAGAAILVDGVRVEGNPFTARFPRDGAAHQVQAQADGYQTARRLVVFDADHRVEVKLEHAGHAASAAHPVALPRLQAAPEPAAPAAAAPRPEPPAAPAAHHAPRPAPRPEPAAPEKVYKGTKGKLITDYP